MTGVQVQPVLPHLSHHLGLTLTPSSQPLQTPGNHANLNEGGAQYIFLRKVLISIQFYLWGLSLDPNLMSPEMG